jgi:hypothetical protein
MTTPPLFPALPGQGWSVHKKPTFATIVASHVSGREVRDALYVNPIWQFELTFDGLDGSTNGQYPGLGAESMQALMGLFLQCQGQLSTFLYADPSDNSISGQTIAAGDGATTTFAFARALGGFLEPVGWVTSVSQVTLGGAVIPSAGLSPPASPTLSSVAGGALAAATLYVETTYVTASGETPPSAVGSLAVAADDLLVVASPAAPAPASAVGWNVYVGASSGAEQKQNGSTPIAIGANWTEPTTGLVSGTAAPPSANTTGWSLTTPNSLVFAAAPASGALIGWTGAYAFQCRFDDDTADFEQFMQNLWRLDSLKFRSVRSS